MAVPDSGVTWNEAKPDNDTVAHQIDDFNRHLMIGVRSRMEHEHVWPAAQTATNQAGYHEFITFQAQDAPTMAGTTGGAVYVRTDYAFAFLHSDGSEVIVVGTDKSVLGVTGGTQGSIPICSSANSTGLVMLAGSAAGLPLVTHYNTAAPTYEALSSVGISSAAVTGGHISAAFGTWNNSFATSGRATSDGILVCMGANGTASGFTDANNPASVLVVRDYAAVAFGSWLHMTFPVKKNDYYLITGNCTSFSWLPLGA